ncbi:hypothetical protein [Streptomyces cyaneofuscatus]|uniref:hypothetical protein n=1 Tax=Streptomyces cyaneofuscatus TaxID=66883 RepID=UPI0037A62C6D
MTQVADVLPCHVLAPPAVFATVEPLFLPEPGTRPPACPHAEGRCHQQLDADLDLLRQAATGMHPRALRAPEDTRRRTRYRWVVGHHAAFAVWQCLRRSLEEAEDGPGPPEPAIHTAARLYDVYSVLFLYTGGCPPRRYAETVRADMTARHPAFSGEWARDYQAIPELTKRVRALHPETTTAPLTEAARLNHRVHMAVARKLVPDGASLLQEAGRRPGKAPSEAERELYDDYFAVHREVVCESAFAAQLVRRLAQVLCDVCVYGLTEADSPPAGFGPPHTGSVEAFEYKAGALLRALAENLAATARPPVVHPNVPVRAGTVPLQQGASRCPQ